MMQGMYWKTVTDVLMFNIVSLALNFWDRRTREKAFEENTIHSFTKKQFFMEVNFFNVSWLKHF